MSVDNVKKVNDIFYGTVNISQGYFDLYANQDRTKIVRLTAKLSNGGSVISFTGNIKADGTVHLNIETTRGPIIYDGPVFGGIVEM